MQIETKCSSVENRLYNQLKWERIVEINSIKLRRIPVITNIKGKSVLALQNF